MSGVEWPSRPASEQDDGVGGCRWGAASGDQAGPRASRRRPRGWGEDVVALEAPTTPRTMRRGGTRRGASHGVRRDDGAQTGECSAAAKGRRRRETLSARAAGSRRSSLRRATPARPAAAPSSFRRRGRPPQIRRRPSPWGKSADRATGWTWSVVVGPSSWTPRGFEGVVHRVAQGTACRGAHQPAAGLRDDLSAGCNAARACTSAHHTAAAQVGERSTTMRCRAPRARAADGERRKGR